MLPPAIPPYPHQRSGAAIVCGSAWTLLGDYEKASRLRPGAFVVCVNDAVKHVRGDAIFSVHYEKMPLWIARHCKRWVGDRPETHTCGRPSPGNLGWVAENGGQVTDYFWPVERGAGSSGWEAGKIAHRMGFDEIIYCGVQLAPGLYQDGWEGWSRPDYARDYRAAVEADVEFWPHARAMSGWLADKLGEPDD